MNHISYILWNLRDTTAIFVEIDFSILLLNNKVKIFRGWHSGSFDKLADTKLLMGSVMKTTPIPVPTYLSKNAIFDIDFRIN